MWWSETEEILPVVVGEYRVLGRFSGTHHCGQNPENISTFDIKADRFIKQIELQELSLRGGSNGNILIVYDVNIEHVDC